RMQLHQEPGNIAALQGGRTRPGERWELFQANWSPTTRMLISMAGGGLLAYGFTQRAPLACIMGTFGLGLMTAGATNLGVRDLLPESEPARGEARPAPAGSDGRMSMKSRQPVLAR